MPPKVSFYYQGAPGAYSHAAAERFATGFSDPVEFLHQETFGEVFSHVNDENSYGVIPLENSTIGAISANYDLLRSFEGTILAETFLPIQHCLLASPGSTLTKIERVYSHPVALQQCQLLFKANPRMQPVEFTDTAGAAALVQSSNNPTLAAIAREHAATLYGLDIIEANIQDYPNNQTRFVLIGGGAMAGKRLEGRTQASHFKATLLIEDIHMKELSLSLPLHTRVSSVVSRPIPELTWHYALFVDLVDEPPVINNLFLQHLPGRLLGIYAAGDADYEFAPPGATGA